jgi:hypothetical protein
LAKGEWGKTTRLIDAAIEILETENPMTVRQLFYRLVSAAEIENTRADYQRVSVVMTKAREDARCKYDWIVDRSRPTYSPNMWTDAAEYAEAVKRGYRKDYWETQPNYVELWVEKDAIIGSIQDLTDELGVTVRVGRGFLSTTRAHDIAQILYGIRKPKTIFYLGDHDPSGRCIEEEAAKRVKTHYHNIYLHDPDYEHVLHYVVLEVERLAIEPEDIAAFDLPPLRVKPRDTRADGFLAEYGNECVELDALPPTELRSRIREAVESKLDMEKWNRAVEVERVELRNILETVGSWSISSRE